MADRRDNVIVYPGWEGDGGRQPIRLEVLRVAVGQLDELGCHLQELSPQPGWPPHRWMIASIPFRLRLTIAREKLGDLAMASPAGGQHPIRWALKFDKVRLEAERRLHDIDRCLYTLQHADASPAERARGTEMFAANKSEFLRVLGQIRHLIAERSQAELAEAEGRLGHL
jgi:hypothetical protein